MSASADVQTGMTYAIFHGCDKQDEKILLEWLKLTTFSAGHPLLLPSLFAELQLKRYLTLTRENWTRLVKLCADTGQYRKPSQQAQASPPREDAFNYDNTTREILQMYQDTEFLVKDLTKIQNELKQMMGLLDLIRTAAPDTRKDFIARENARIGERLEEIVAEYDALLAECKLITDGASLLTNAVWNLIAQRDNNVNQSIAADSREIAAAARRDSSAMKAIAFLTMFFLPGTFVASFFAMPLLDWDAKNGDDVISHRFWIYWAVVTPLTVLVLMLWGIWYLFTDFLPSQKDLEKTKGE
ncbi:MAG: hypothetical protein Q9167_003030 [Letrouitia subvulpina]